MQQLLEHVRQCKVNIDGNICAVIVTTLVLEVSSAYYFMVFIKIFLVFLCLNMN